MLKRYYILNLHLWPDSKPILFKKGENLTIMHQHDYKKYKKGIPFRRNR